MARAEACSTFLPASFARCSPQLLRGIHDTRASSSPHRNFCGRTRREFLWEAGAGFTGLALTGLSRRRLLRQAGPRRQAGPAIRQPARPEEAALAGQGEERHLPVHVRRPQPGRHVRLQAEAVRLDGKTITVKTFGRGGQRNQGRVVGPKWKFKQYGQCGKWVSDLFPHLATCVDDIAFLHSMTADSPIHGSAMLQMNTGKILSGSPCLGSWVNYGLGSVNQNLPGFVRHARPDRRADQRRRRTGPAATCRPRTRARSCARPATPILDLQPPARHQPSRCSAACSTRCDEYNAEHQAAAHDNSNLAARIASYELAFKMQQHAPEAVDLTQGNRGDARSCTASTTSRTADFGRKCLLARRLVERGVRFVQIYSGGAHNDDNWDAHGDLVQQPHLPRRRHRQADRRPAQGPEAARPARRDADRLGRRVRPAADRRVRRRAPAAITTPTASPCGWPAAASRAASASARPTNSAAPPSSDRFHVKNLHATILHQMGLDPNG